MYNYSKIGIFTKQLEGTSQWLLTNTASVYICQHLISIQGSTQETCFYDRETRCALDEFDISVILLFSSVTIPVLLTVFVLGFVS